MDNNIEFKVNKNLLIVILCVVVGILIAYIVLNTISGGFKTPIPAEVAQNNTPAQNQVTVVPVIPEFTISPSQDSPDVNIFTSEKLGITFTYLKYFYSDDENNPGINHSVIVNSPKADGNKILFGPAYDSYMMVYHKEPNQSLESAIKAQFLAKIPTTQCLTSRVQAGADDAFYTPSSKISFVRLHDVSTDGCPLDLNFNNPSAAFFSFANQPDKFFYVVGEADNTMPLRTPSGDPFFTTIQSIAQ